MYKAFFSGLRRKVLLRPAPRQLRCLHLTGNPLTALPADLWRLAQLSYLNVSADQTGGLSAGEVLAQGAELRALWPHWRTASLTEAKTEDGGVPKAVDAMAFRKSVFHFFLASH